MEEDLVIPPNLTCGRCCYSHVTKTLGTMTWLCSCWTIHVYSGFHSLLTWNLHAAQLFLYRGPPPLFQNLSEWPLPLSFISFVLIPLILVNHERLCGQTPAKGEKAQPPPALGHKWSAAPVPVCLLFCFSRSDQKSSFVLLRHFNWDAGLSWWSPQTDF